MARDISQAVRELLSSFPEVEEVISHGSPSFKVRGKTFATYTINHHGDGRVALNLDSPPGAQQLYTEMEPEYYFVPPYTGPKGWLGIELDKGLSWETVAARAREAYEKNAPPALAAGIGDSVRIRPPDRNFRPEEINRFLGKRARAVLGRLDAICERLPETSQATQFGNPVWKAGKKTFVSTHYYTGRLALSFWVGTDAQTLLTQDSRYRIPAYTGQNGWIDLDVEDQADWEEIEQLTLESYRHFALKRMLKALGEA
ncbi:MAG: MmcQ/YjbR family DNA-binding protein [Pseudomonadales bacterium]